MKVANEGFGAGNIQELLGRGGDFAVLEEAVGRVGHLVALQSPRRRSRRRDQQQSGHETEQTCQDLGNGRK